MRTRDDLLLERDYWQHLLTDITTVNDQVIPITSGLSRLAGEAALAAVFNPALDELAAQIHTAYEFTALRMSLIQDALMRMLALADGRASMLEGEIKDGA